MSRRRTLLVACLALLVGVPAGWLWPVGLVEHRLGPFAFQAPIGVAIEPDILDPALSVSMSTREPSWNSTPQTIQVGGHVARVLRGSHFAPVVGGSRWEPDVRDHDVLIWFPDLQQGLYVYWRTFGGARYWMRDTRLTRSAEALVASLRVEA